MSAVVDLGFVFRSRSTNIDPEGLTAHYGGLSPWGDADRSSAAAFAASTDHNRCPSILRAWHDYHLSKGWFGFAYTSGVCPHGVRYEGRGPGTRTGAQGTNDGNQRSYATVYVAGGSDPITDEARRAFHAEAGRLAVPLRWVHSDWKATACPGDPIRTWKADGWPVDGSDSPEPPPPSPGTPDTRPTKEQIMALPELRRGATGQHVRNLQGLLVAHGNKITVDGDFGPITQSTLKAWQARTRRLVSDGIAGPATWSWLTGVS